MPTIEEVKARLEGIEGHVAVAIWQRGDVIGTAKEMGIELTGEQADEILDNIDSHQDSEYGIHWEMLRSYIHEARLQMWRDCLARETKHED